MGSGRLRTSAFCLAWTVFAPVVGLAVCAHPAGAADVTIEKAPYSTFEINKIISASEPLTAEKAKTLDVFFDRWFLPLFATKPHDLPELRNKYYKVVVRGAGKTPAHDYVNKKLAKAMVGVLGARGASRAVKYNAMLILAELNDSDQPGATTPMPGALRYLTFVAFTDNQEYDYLKPAALYGLARYAEAGGIPKGEMAAVIQNLLKIVEEKDSPAGRTASAHNFLRRSAASALAKMRHPGPENRVVKAFAQIAADSKASATLRCEIARYIGELQYPPQANVDLGQLANILGHETIELCRRELDRTPERANPSRQLLMYVLDSNTAGLDKLAGSAPASGDASKLIDSVRSKVRSLYRDLDDFEKTPDGSVAQTVETVLGELEAELGPKPETVGRAADNAPDQLTAD